MQLGCLQPTGLECSAGFLTSLGYITITLVTLLAGCWELWELLPSPWQLCNFLLAPQILISKEFLMIAINDLVNNRLWWYCFTSFFFFFFFNINDMIEAVEPHLPFPCKREHKLYRLNYSYIAPNLTVWVFIGSPWKLVSFVAPPGAGERDWELRPIPWACSWSQTGEKDNTWAA